MGLTAGYQMNTGKYARYYPVQSGYVQMRGVPVDVLRPAYAGYPLLVNHYQVQGIGKVCVNTRISGPRVHQSGV